MKRTFICLCLALTMGVAVPACSSRKSVETPDGVAPPPAVTGPAYLRGTVGSLCNIRGFSSTLVSGYGLVVMPQGSGTGSAEVPAFLRQWMLQEMRRRGFGQAKFRAQNLNAEQFLASEDTAVVAVQGLIPPGAKKGTRFDLLVTALPATQTTSLRGGRLFTTDLSIGGLDRSMAFRRPIGRGGGETYVNPFSDDTPEQEALKFSREAVVLAGGVVLDDRPLELVLNQASYRRSSDIANRINERFPASPNTKARTAEPASDRIIRLNIPRQFADKPAEFLRMTSKVFLQRVTGFEEAKARELLEVARAQPAARGDVHYALIALGKTIIPLLRQEYDHPDLDYRLSLLEVGIRLDDGQAVLDLAELADHPEADFRTRVVRSLAYAPDNMRAQRVLGQRLRDTDDQVRIAAYEVLVDQASPLVQRLPIGDGHNVRFMLDLINADRPMVFIAQQDLPRIVIFGANAPFDTPLFAQLQDGRLMLRGMEPDEPVQVYFEPRHGGESRTFEIAPTVGNLAFLLGHHPHKGNPTDGLNLSYGETVNAIYRLHAQGVVPGDMKLQISPLAETIATLEDQAESRPDSRPETEDDVDDQGNMKEPDGPFIPLDRDTPPGDTMPQGNDAPASDATPSRPEVGS